MKYITGIHALNLPCSLETCGDWHTSALNWQTIKFKESTESIFGDYGIEVCNSVPENDGTYYIANTLRALLDLLIDNNIGLAQGAKDDFICNNKYTQEFFEKVIQLKDLPNWKHIDEFMSKEYLFEWDHFKGDIHISRRIYMYDNWTEQHKDMINKFVVYLNEVTNEFILKGGTALMLFYQLDRFSDDIELDAIGDRADIEIIIKNFCREFRLDYKILKDTKTLKKYRIYFETSRELNVKVSYRRSKRVHENEVEQLNGTVVYTIQSLAMLKLTEYLFGNKIRDLYDLLFIYKNFKSDLPESIILQLQYAIQQKGFEYFDYNIRTQPDRSINRDKLDRDFVSVYSDLGFK